MDRRCGRRCAGRGVIEVRLRQLVSSRQVRSPRTAFRVPRGALPWWRRRRNPAASVSRRPALLTPPGPGPVEDFSWRQTDRGTWGWSSGEGTATVARACPIPVAVSRLETVRPVAPDGRGLDEPHRAVRRRWWDGTPLPAPPQSRGCRTSAVTGRAAPPRRRQQTLTAAWFPAHRQLAKRRLRGEKLSLATKLAPGWRVSTCREDAGMPGAGRAAAWRLQAILAPPAVVATRRRRCTRSSASSALRGLAGHLPYDHGHRAAAPSIGVRAGHLTGKDSWRWFSTTSASFQTVRFTFADRSGVVQLTPTSTLLMLQVRPPRASCRAAAPGRWVVASPGMRPLFTPGASSTRRTLGRDADAGGGLATPGTILPEKAPSDDRRAFSSAGHLIRGSPLAFPGSTTDCRSSGGNGPGAA